jgi:hypothetical protein
VILLALDLAMGLVEKNVIVFVTQDVKVALDLVWDVLRLLVVHIILVVLRVVVIVVVVVLVVLQTVELELLVVVKDVPQVAVMDVRAIAVGHVVGLVQQQVQENVQTVQELVLKHAEVIAKVLVTLLVSQLVLVIVLHLALQGVMEVQSLGVMDVIQNVLQQLMLTLNYKKASYIINYITSLLFFINKKNWALPNFLIVLIYYY